MSLLQQELGFRFYVASRLFSQQYRDLLDSLGLTYPQYLVMLCLWEKDGLIVSQIGKQLSLDSGTLTPLLKCLEAMNLVRRVRSESDERRVEIQLSYPGKSLQSKAIPIAQSMEQTLSGWKEKEREKLVELMDRLIGELGKE
ncbi:MarR family winged helix-turn-helix transcriptional regulator [Mongoliitalea daihaiensis]|uniref:MarR family winged helix-turn-helix transcriptional regulator n=1 Tax=Mongoliitalea daihaiensis TaxID=2782006 RepID=UPI001F1AF8A1|nr:MarR family transcriptional regulator [Mongoliitalea daihaiensis]UJP65899.1 MarR family transcriptional regulator [Mongoliitalea daihaiensis]